MWATRRVGSDHGTSDPTKRRETSRTVAEGLWRGKKIRRGSIPGLQVDFGTDYYTGDGVHAAEVDDLVVHDLDHVEGLVICDRVDENVAMDADGMLGVEDGVFILGAEMNGRVTGEGRGGDVPGRRCR